MRGHHQRTYFTAFKMPSKPFSWSDLGTGECYRVSLFCFFTELFWAVYHHFRHKLGLTLFFVWSWAVSLIFNEFEANSGCLRLKQFAKYAGSNQSTQRTFKINSMSYKAGQRILPSTCTGINTTSNCGCPLEESGSQLNIGTEKISSKILSIWHKRKF